MILYILIYFIVTSALLSIILDKKIEESIPVVMLLCGIIISLFTYMKNVYLGIYISVYGLPLLLTAYIIFSSIIRKEFPSIHINKLFTIGLFAFIFLCLYGYLLGRNRYLSIFDEYTFWGIRSFDMLKYNQLYSTFKEGLASGYEKYPLFFSSIQCFFCYFGQDFKEPYLYIANNICCFSFILPLFSLLDIHKIKDIIKSILLTICIILLGICISKYEAVSLYECIYVDYPMIFVAGFSFFLSNTINKNNIKDLLVFAISIIGVVMSKQICLFFACLIILNFIIQNYNVKKNFIYIACIALILGLIILYFFNKIIGLSIFSNIIQIMFNKNIWEHSVILLFFKEMFTSSTSAGIINLPYFWYLLIIVSLFLLLSYILFNKTTLIKNIILSILLFVGGLIWSLAQLTFEISRTNAEIFENHLWLPSYNRYMGSFLYFVLLCILIIFVYELNTNNKKYSDAILYALPILMLFCSNISYFDSLLPLNKPSGIITDPKTLSIINVMDDIPNNSNLLIVEQYEEGYTYVDYINLYYYEYDINKKCYKESFGEDSYKDQNRLNITVEKYLDYISDYDYLYILFADDQYITNYWGPTASAEFLVNGLYKINKNTDNITLELVELY